jgi:hypothetical protein
MAAKSHDFIKITSSVPQMAPLTEAGSISAYLRNGPDKCGCLARQIRLHCCEIHSPHRHLISSPLECSNTYLGIKKTLSFWAVVRYILPYNIVGKRRESVVVLSGMNSVVGVRVEAQLCVMFP